MYYYKNMPEELLGRNSAEQQLQLLAKINSALAGLGSGAKYTRLPENREEYESLRGRRVVMVDDTREVLEDFVGDLMLATGGNASFLLHTGQSVEEIVGVIKAENLDVVLLDYNLSGDTTGSMIAESLLEAGFSGLIIGFSSDSDTTQDFMRSGVRTCIEKEPGMPEISVMALGRMLKEKQQ